MRKVGTFHKARRTSASASTKVGRVLSYQTARRTQGSWPCQRSWAMSVTSENSPSNAVTIGRASQPFPRSKPDVRVSPHPAFQTPVLVPVACPLSLAGFAVSLGRVLPNVSANKEVNLGSFPFVLVGLHRVPSITAGRLATTPPPSSCSHADIFASLTGEVM